VTIVVRVGLASERKGRTVQIGMENMRRFTGARRDRPAGAVTVRMKRMPAVAREILILVFAMAIFLTAFAYAFPTSQG
jgi:hypothetical protein